MSCEAFDHALVVLTRVIKDSNSEDFTKMNRQKTVVDLSKRLMALTGHHRPLTRCRNGWLFIPSPLKRLDGVAVWFNASFSAGLPHLMLLLFWFCFCGGQVFWIICVLDCFVFLPFEILASFGPSGLHIMCNVRCNRYAIQVSYRDRAHERERHLLHDPALVWIHCSSMEIDTT